MSRSVNTSFIKSAIAVMATALIVFCASEAFGQLPPIIDLDVPPGTEASPVLRIHGDDAGDQTSGNMHPCVASGDINGDGLSDLIVGAPLAAGHTGIPGAGEVYVIYGTASLTSLAGATLDLNTDGAISAASETRIVGDTSPYASYRGNLGNTVASGDVNGDGFDDIIVSAPFANSAGAIYIFYGSSSLPGSLMNLANDATYSQYGETRILSEIGYRMLGDIAIGCGDINNDGYDDVVFNDKKAKAYVYYGSPTLPNAVLYCPSGTDLTIIGNVSPVGAEFFGTSFCFGDIDGDLNDDLVIGNRWADPGDRTDAGAVYILYGDHVLPSTIDLQSPDESYGETRILGDDEGDEAGISVASGDVNGDNVDDVIIGAHYATPGDPEATLRAGEVYVIYGRTDLRGVVVDLQDSPGSNGETRVLGVDIFDFTGYSVSTGDVNGDEIDDLILGSWGVARGSGFGSSGEVSVIYGSALIQGTTIDLGTGGQDVRVLGEMMERNRFGRYLPDRSGDMNGDGFDDIMAGGSADNPSIPDYPDDAGGVAIVFGAGENNSPIADAGVNLAIASQDQCITVIQGTTSDADDDFLSFRWLEGENVLWGLADVGANGEAYLDLSAIASLSLGEHHMTLEVSDGQTTDTDDMILTVNNSAPNVAATGGGTYEINTPVILGGQVSDFDGDLLNYDWSEGAPPLFTGQVQAMYGGEPVNLPEHILYPDFGGHTYSIQVSDRINDPVPGSVEVHVQDTMAPTLAPVADKGILWPPNHKLVDITIEANASDNSGNIPTLTAAVSSNEPQGGLGDGDTSPDWREPVVDQTIGTITLQLRAERSGSGDGRVYTVTITATDDSGNHTSADVEIIVPHDKRKK